ncbi:MAG: DUF2791 family P-loop domain-containing protein [Deltaproteobacteria bacterium]|nr:DUF2791 family P-loop domain-containing protein [Deltaproteobacteria bacterium]
MKARDCLEVLASYGVPPDGRTALRTSVGLDDLLQRFANETLPFLTEGGCEIRFVEAPYGRGKSHVLRALEAVAQDHGFVTSYVDCHSQSKPFGSFADTYRQISRRLSVPGRTEDQEAGSGIGNLITAVMESGSYEARNARILAVRNDLWLCREMRNLVLGYAGAPSSDGSVFGLRGQLLEILLGRMPAGLTISALVKSNPRLPRPLGRLGRRNAGSWLRSLCSLPKAMGFPGFVLLFDETEQSLSIGGLGLGARMQHFANLRNLADYIALGGVRGCAICYAVVEDFLPMAHKVLGALAQRIERLAIEYQGRKLPNPRAIWTTLDELTNPAPGEVLFYERLLERLLDLGSEAGVSDDDLDLVRSLCQDLAKRYANRIDPGAVRSFVKEVAGLIR